MKKHATATSLALTLALSTLAFATLFTPAAIADEEREVKLKVMAGDELVTLDLSDLELGQSQQITTESGKLITATRDDQGYELDIEGKRIRIGDHGHGGVQVHSGDDDRIVIHERREHKEIREIRLDDGDVVEINGPLALEIGETREWTTKNGATATLSRDEEGIVLTVDGEQIRLPHHPSIAMMHGSGEGEHIMHWQSKGDGESYAFHHVSVDCDDENEDCEKNVRIHTMGSKMAFVHCDDGEEDCAERIQIKHLDLDNMEEMKLEDLDLESLGLENLDLDGDVKVFMVKGQDGLELGEMEGATRVIVLRGEGGGKVLLNEGEGHPKVMMIELEENVEIEEDLEPR